MYKLRDGRLEKREYFPAKVVHPIRTVRLAKFAAADGKIRYCVIVRDNDEWRYERQSFLKELKKDLVSFSGRLLDRPEWKSMGLEFLVSWKTRVEQAGMLYLLPRDRDYNFSQMKPATAPKQIVQGPATPTQTPSELALVCGHKISNPQTMCEQAIKDPEAKSGCRLELMCPICGYVLNSDERFRALGTSLLAKHARNPPAHRDAPQVCMFCANDTSVIKIHTKHACCQECWKKYMRYVTGKTAEQLVEEKAIVKCPARDCKFRYCVSTPGGKFASEAKSVGNSAVDMKENELPGQIEPSNP